MSKKSCPSCGSKNVKMIFYVTPPDWEEYLKELAEKKITSQSMEASLKYSILECGDCSLNWGKKNE